MSEIIEPDLSFNELHTSRAEVVDRIFDNFARHLFSEERELVSRIINVIDKDSFEKSLFQFSLKHGKYGGCIGIDFTDVDLSKISLRKVVMYLKLYGLPTKIIDSGKPPGNG